MVPAELNLTIYEGTNYNLSILWKDDNDNPVDLTNFTASMHIRDTIESAAKIDCSPYFTLGGTAGTVSLALPATFIVDIGYTSGVYDIDLEDTSGNVYRLLLGTVTIREEVTR